MKEKYVNFLGVFKNHEVDGIDGNKYEGLSKTCCRKEEGILAWNESKVLYSDVSYSHIYLDWNAWTPTTWFDNPCTIIYYTVSFQVFVVGGGVLRKGNKISEKQKQNIKRDSVTVS